MSSSSASVGHGDPQVTAAYAVGGMVRALTAVRLTVLLLAAAQSLLTARPGAMVIVAFAAAPFSFVPALNWRTRGPAYFRNGMLLAADLVLALLVLLAMGGLPLIATYAVATVALWGVTAGARLTVLMAVPMIMLLIPWNGLLVAWRSTAVVLLTVGAVLAMAFAGSALGRNARRQHETAALLAREHEALAAAQERLRIARDLHDTVAGDLAGLTMLVEALRTRLVADGASEPAMARLRSVDDAVRTAHRHTRSALDDLRSTPGTLRVEVAALTASWSERVGVAVQTRVGDDTDGVPEALVDDAVLVVRELLENVRKHAQATHVEVRAHAEDGGLVVTVEDDGKGCGPTRSTGRHHGVRGVRERAESWGGDARWEPSVTGGTRVRVFFAAGREAERVDAVRGAREVA